MSTVTTNAATETPPVFVDGAGVGSGEGEGDGVGWKLQASSSELSPQSLTPLHLQSSWMQMPLDLQMSDRLQVYVVKSILTERPSAVGDAAYTTKMVSERLSKLLLPVKLVSRGLRTLFPS